MPTNDNGEHDPVEAEIWSVNVADGEMTQLTDRDGPDFGAVISPDGKTIALEQFSEAGSPPALALETDDIEAEVARLKAAGVKFGGEILDAKTCKSNLDLFVHGIVP